VRSGDSYGLVFALLVLALFAGIAAPEELWTRVIRDVVFAAAIIVAYWTVTPVRSFAVARVLLPGVALAIVIVGGLEGAGTGPASAALAAAATAAVAMLVARDLFQRRHVDLQTVLGALSFYLLSGFLFAWLFTLTADLGDEALFTRGDDGTSADHLYFSFVTLTTTGYGDLAAADGVGRSFAVSEMILGELYLITVVAVLVTAAARRQLLGRDDV
jgi:hypothetical protein